MRSHRPHLPGHRHAQGFTLIEVMVVVALLGILSAFAVPSLQNYLDRNRVRSFSNDLFASLQYAKAEALARGGGVRFCPNLGAATSIDCPSKFAVAKPGFVQCGPDFFDKGWKISTTAEVIRTAQQALPGGIRVCLNGNGKTSHSIDLDRLGRPSEPFVALSVNGNAFCRFILVHPSGLIQMYPETQTKQSSTGQCVLN